MKQKLEKAIEALPGGKRKWRRNQITLPPIEDRPHVGIAIQARTDGTQAEDLAAKIGLAFLRYGNVPDASAVAKELQGIADLSRDLHRALNHTTSPAIAHIADSYGGYGGFRLIRRDLLAKLAVLNRATSLPKSKSGKPKAKRGAKPDLLAKAVADAAASTYLDVTGREPTRVTNSETDEPIGAFHVFLTSVFAAAGVDADPRTHVQRLTAGRKPRKIIAA